MRRTASGLRASAPRPYTVSVGNATSFPAASSAAARSIALASAGVGCRGMSLLCTTEWDRLAGVSARTLLLKSRPLCLARTGVVDDAPKVFRANGRPCRSVLDERFPFHVGICVGRPSRQGGGPDLGRGAGYDSRARPPRP